MKKKILVLILKVIGLTIIVLLSLSTQLVGQNQQVFTSNPEGHATVVVSPEGNCSFSAELTCVSSCGGQWEWQIQAPVAGGWAMAQEGGYFFGTFEPGSYRVQSTEGYWSNGVWNPCWVLYFWANNIFVGLDLDCTSATAVVSGGTAPYAYAWDTGATSASISGLSPEESHCVTVTDSNGCEKVQNFTVPECPDLCGDPEYNFAEATICSGESYMRPNGGMVYTSGVYIDTIQGVDGCDIIVVTELTVNPIMETFVSMSGCEEVYLPDGQRIENSGSVVVNYVATDTGCDSTVIYSVEVYSSVTTTINAEICEGEVYELDGYFYNHSGSYPELFQTAQGCDSVVILNLTVSDPVIQVIEDQPVCNLDEVGVTTQVFQNEAGCDSLELTTNYYWEPAWLDPVLTDTCVENVSAITDTVRVDGCDFLQQTVFHFVPNFEEETVWVCEPQVDESYTETDANGCVTEVITHFEVYPEAVGYETLEICESELPLVWNGITISNFGCYQSFIEAGSVHGCDSLVNLSLIVHEAEETVIEDWTCNPDSVGAVTVPFMNQFGCDSLVTTVTSLIASDIQIEMSPDTTIECSDEWPEFFVNAYALTENGDTVTLDYNFTEVHNDSDPCEIFVQRDIAVTGFCGEVVEDSQTMWVVDESAPEFVVWPEDLTVHEDSLETILNDTTGITISDCSEVTLTTYFVEVNDSTYIRTWTAVDLCGNESEQAQMIYTERAAPEEPVAYNPCEVNIHHHKSSHLEVVIKSLHGPIKSGSWSLFSAEGKAIKSGNIGGNGSVDVEFDVPIYDLSAGVYFLRLVVVIDGNSYSLAYGGDAVQFKFVTEAYGISSLFSNMGYPLLVEEEDNSLYFVQLDTVPVVASPIGHSGKGVGLIYNPDTKICTVIGTRPGSDTDCCDRELASWKFEVDLPPNTIKEVVEVEVPRLVHPKAATPVAQPIVNNVYNITVEGDTNNYYQDSTEVKDSCLARNESRTVFGPAVRYNISNGQAFPEAGFTLQTNFLFFNCNGKKRLLELQGEVNGFASSRPLDPLQVTCDTCLTLIKQESNAVYTTEEWAQVVLRSEEDSHLYVFAGPGMIQTWKENSVSSFSNEFAVRGGVGFTVVKPKPGKFGPTVDLNLSSIFRTQKDLSPGFQVGLKVGLGKG